MKNLKKEDVVLNEILWRADGEFGVHIVKVKCFRGEVIVTELVETESKPAKIFSTGPLWKMKDVDLVRVYLAELKEKALHDLNLIEETCIAGHTVLDEYVSAMSGK